MFVFIERIFAYIMEIVNALGYFGIGGGMLIESACIPIPSELILPLAGSMVSTGKITMLGANLAVGIGSLIGSLIAYAVGYYGGRPFINKFGKYIHITEKKFNRAERTFNKYGAAAVFFGRLLPIIRTFISLPAGIARMKLPKFIIYSLLGMVPWNFILIYLGFVFGENYATVIRPIFKEFENIVLAAIVLAIIVLVLISRLGKSGAKRS